MHDQATAAASPAPDQTRRGGSGPAGRADRTDEHVISVGDALTGDDPEPPAGTEVELSDGTRWKRVPLYARGWPYGVGEPSITRRWQAVTAAGSVTVKWLAPKTVLEWDERPEYAIMRGFPAQWRPVTWDIIEDQDQAGGQ